MEPLFCKKDYRIICQLLRPELEKLEREKDYYQKLVEFLIVGEDHRYYSHIGFDVLGVCRAIFRDLFQGKREGASTIEQQLVRVLTEDYRYSIKRKLKEIYLATKLKRLADKYTLAAAYLDLANYGTDLSGLTSVLNRFGVSLQQEIDDSVCAEVVARLKYPEPRHYNENRIAQIERRAKYILWLHQQYKKKNECR